MFQTPVTVSNRTSKKRQGSTLRVSWNTALVSEVILDSVICIEENNTYYQGCSLHEGQCIFLKPGFIEHFGYTHSSTYFSAVFYSSSPGFRAEVKGLTLGRRLHTCPLRARSKAWAGVWAAV